MPLCHCGSGKSFEDCCSPLISGDSAASSAEALMRSRYSAYVVRAIDYLGETLHPAHRGDWDRDATRSWAETAEWISLEIVETEAGRSGDDEGWVEFVATFSERGRVQRHHERSRFLRAQGHWYYVDGETPKPKTQRLDRPRVGRNDPCPCGSGKKFKKCCGR